MNKICTSLEQSKKLLELGLNINTADMHYVLIDADEDKYDAGLGKYIGILPHYPCWSLTALLGVLPDESGDDHFLTLQKEKNEYCCCYEDINGNSFRHTFADNPVDACVTMIEKLHERKLI